jgi:iron complex transport system substrate-binding protein
LLCVAFLFTTPAMGRAPRRIVSLDLCTDWMLARHVARERVAALSPMQRRYLAPWMPRDWPLHDGALESIVRLRPDLVIVGEYVALSLREQLKYLGIEVVILPLPRTLAEAREYELRFLALLELPARRASAIPPAHPASRKRLLLLGANGIGTGRDTFEDALLTRAGWQNYLTDRGYVRLDLEKIVRDPPDAVLRASPSGPALANAFSEHPAWRALIPPPRQLATDYWRWQCPGPWSWELVQGLRNELEP